VERYAASEGGQGKPVLSQYLPVARTSGPKGPLEEFLRAMSVTRIQHASVVLYALVLSRPAALPLLPRTASDEGLLLRGVSRAAGGVSGQAKGYATDLKRSSTFLSIRPV
jgi:hypothetical protein